MPDANFADTRLASGQPRHQFGSNHRAVSLQFQILQNLTAKELEATVHIRNGEPEHQSDEDRPSLAIDAPDQRVGPMEPTSNHHVEFRYTRRQQLHIGRIELAVTVAE